MAIETTLQNFLHAFDQGSAAAWVRRIIVATIVALIAMMWFVFKFNGFSVPDAMDQAQIGRQVAGGQGYTTLYVRPLAMHLGLARRGSLDMPLRDANQAPLGPLLNAAVFRISGMNFAPARSSAAMGTAMGTAPFHDWIRLTSSIAVPSSTWRSALVAANCAAEVSP